MADKEKTTTKTTKPAPGDKPAANLPEHQLGDTPVAPWEMPTPEQKDAAKPVREALTEAISEVETQAKADQVIETLESALGDRTADDVVRGDQKETVEGAAQAVEQAANGASAEDKTVDVLAETAKVIELAEGTEKEALAEAAQEVFGHEQLGVEKTWYDRRRELLHKAMLKRLKPLQALDTELFISVNHLPHNRFLNGIFYFITITFNGGLAWYALMLASVVARGHMNWYMLRATAIPLATATAIVEYPIKSIFRRRRPFISIVRAIVVGMKPGTFSFPSGHAASAFAGAWLLRQHFPRMAPLLYLMAGLVGFSRVYLGDHYPGDVVSGSLAGHLLAVIFGRLFGHKRRK